MQKNIFTYSNYFIVFFSRFMKPKKKKKESLTSFERQSKKKKVFFNQLVFIRNILFRMDLLEKEKKEKKKGITVKKTTRLFLEKKHNKP